MNNIIIKLKEENNNLKNTLDKQIDLTVHKDDQISLLKKDINFYKNKSNNKLKHSKEIQTDNYINQFLNSNLNITMSTNKNSKVDEKLNEIKNKYEFKLKEYADELLVLNRENNKIKTKYKDIDNIIYKFEKNDKKLNEKLEEYKSQILSLKKENSQYVSIIKQDQFTSITSLKKQHNSLKEDNNKNLIRIDFLNSENQQLQNKLIEIINNTKLLKNELFDHINLNSEFKKRFSKISILNDNINKLKEDYIFIKKENIHIKLDNKNKEDDIIELENENKLIKKDYDNLNKHLNKALDDINYYRELNK